MSNPPYILLVDDDSQVIELMQTALTLEGYEVAGFTSGEEALQAISQRRPDLLVLDLNMPKPDGFEILRIQRQAYPYLKILVISGYLQGALLDAAKFFGATATLQKPFTPEALVAKGREVLGG